jgi:hypothetical protein
MDRIETICLWTAELLPLIATLFSFVYGVKHFFKKGKPLFLQSLTMAMASHALGSIYHSCLSLTTEEAIAGFTPAYLGRFGFFLFIITASYGQLDRIVDDGSSKMRPARISAFVAPVCAILLYLPNIFFTDVYISTKIVYGLVWMPAIISVYFNLKHFIIPDLDFGFIKALKPYNLCVLLLCFLELISLTLWNYNHPIYIAIVSAIFSILCICTMIVAKKGVEKWTV